MINIPGLEEYKNFEFNNVFVRTWNIIGFTAQLWENNDSLEQRDTAVFFYYPDEPDEDKWALRYLGESAAVFGCAVFKPEERWLFMMEDGETYVVGHGDDDWEGSVSSTDYLYFSNLKSTKNGYAIAVGPKRHIFIRKAPDQWQQLKNGLYPEGADLSNSGFSDVDGYDLNNLYACGGHGDLWHYNGDMWHSIDLPVNSVLENICCGDDGFIYITTNRREVLRGKLDQWDVIIQDITSEVFESIVCFEGRVIISTVSELYTIENDSFVKWESEIPEMESKAHLAAGDGVLVVMGRNKVVSFDGTSWKTIL